MKHKLHKFIYPIVSKNKYLCWWYMFIFWRNHLLPLYIDVPFFDLQLAAWNNENGRFVFRDWAALRITLRTRSGQWLATIKSGGFEDQKRISKNFKIALKK